MYLLDLVPDDGNVRSRFHSNDQKLVFDCKNLSRPHSSDQFMPAAVGPMVTKD